MVVLVLSTCSDAASGSELKSRLRKDLLFLDAADRVPVRTVVAVVHADTAAVEVEGVGAGSVRP